uniref:BMA-SEC-8, isoform b n=1 Tax=Brugia malayi TaxID=6279 RepID=A0A0K0JRL7_BRUMA|nr:BMA-SEC-8, isoform b [Brugia malayi]
MSDDRPRRIKHSGSLQDNASALLLNMIRTLTSNSSAEQKELDRRRLEAGFTETSKEIDDLVLVWFMTKSQLSDSLNFIKM